MAEFFKLLGKGILYLFLIPLGICFFAVYGIYLFIVWIVMLFRSIILFFKGRPTGLKLPQDIKAQEILNKARDFSEPQPQPQPQVQPQQGVTFNLNINGQHVGQVQQPSANIQNQNPETLDYTAKQIEHKKGDKNND